MNFIYFWRLVREKGFDLMVRSLARVTEETGELPGNIYVFGEGALKESLFATFSSLSCLEDASTLSADALFDLVESSNDEGTDPKIYFFGWQSQETIRRVLEISHFSLMPSRFLETFGLTALESLAEGVPVIGFSKGGVAPFILPELSLSFTREEENLTTLTDAISRASKYPGDDWKKLSDESRRIASLYSEDDFMDKARDILTEEGKKRPKKILLVTDYTTPLGGIETHVISVARLLRSRGYEVEIFGWEIRKGKWARLQRLLWLVLSCYNFVFARKLRNVLREFRPDVVWMHSVSRFLWPLCVQEIEREKSHRSIVTYHDLGIWTVFPSIIEHEDLIPLKSTFSSFHFACRTKNPIRYLSMVAKYFQVRMLRKTLRNFDIHVVPSPFLTKYVEKISEVEHEKIRVLELFL